MAGDKGKKIALLRHHHTMQQADSSDTFAKNAASLAAESHPKPVNTRYLAMTEEEKEQKEAAAWRPSSPMGLEQADTSVTNVKDVREERAETQAPATPAPLVTGKNALEAWL